jgi:hypothetical protein
MLRRLWMLSSPFATFSPTEQSSWDGSWPWLGVLDSQVFCSEMLGLWVCWWSVGVLAHEYIGTDIWDLLAVDRGQGACNVGSEGRQTDSDQILLGHGFFCRGKGSGLMAGQ